MLPVPLPQPFLDFATTPTRPFSPTTLGHPGSDQVMGRGPARAPYLFGLLLPSLLLGEELQMELLLLLLVIFLQLGVVVAGGRDRSGSRLPLAADCSPPSNPSPVVTVLLDAAVGSLTGQWDGGPHREMCALRGCLNGLHQEGVEKGDGSYTLHFPALLVGPLIRSRCQEPGCCSTLPFPGVLEIEVGPPGSVRGLLRERPAL